ncbi:MAG TPA: tetratricopeptide repeat protein [Stellaceae bacterium]|nr:tetratricopeptide repeat protein [Stellaceae bacterium]
MSDAAALSPTDLVEQGRALHRAGRLDEAESLYAKALAQDEDCAEAHQLLAVIAGQRGRFDEAIAGFRRTIALEGPTPDRLFNLAEAYRVTRQFQPALDAYTQAVTIDAGYIAAYRNCAAMVEEATEEARARGDTATADRLAKLAAHYWVGLGHACLRGHDTAAAESAYRCAVALDPNGTEAHNCLGAIALAARRPIEAETCFRRAQELEPRSPLYVSNLGDALLNQARTEEAGEQYRHAIEVDPSFAQARINLEERTLLWLHHRSDLRPREVFAAHLEWGRLAIQRAKEAGDRPARFANSRDPDRPLKIGYVGLDTGSRLAKSCLAPLVSNHDRTYFQATLYATAASGSADARYFKRLGDRFVLLPLLRAKEAARMMRGAGFDVLIDIAGHQPRNRLDIFALKPAPVTVSWLGYPDTTGLPTVDYRITDETADPLGAEELYTERLYRLRSGSFVYRPPDEAPEISPVPALGSSEVTFGNFDDPLKISPETVQTWSSILHARPRARLMLMAPEFADVAFTKRIHSVFQAAGVSATRVQLRWPPEDIGEQLRAYNAVDIGLDTFPYNGAPTTICEALWMGVPVITLTGDRPCARTSTSVLSQVGLERLDSQSTSEYVETAVELAADLERLQNLRTGMRDRMRVSPLMDARDFARRFEAALRDMWRQWCKSG